jgi:hypothetical protein
MGRTDPPKTELWYNFLSASLRQSVATIARVIFEGSQITSVIPFRSEHDVNHHKLRPAPHFALLIRLQSGEHFILPLMICMVGGHERGISVKDRKPWDIQSLRCKPIMEKFADSPILRCQNAHVVGIGTTNYSATVKRWETGGQTPWVGRRYATTWDIATELSDIAELCRMEYVYAINHEYDVSLE